MLLDHMYIAALVTRIQNNDSNAFAELYALTYQKEYHFACNYLKDPVLAQDALQETYIRAYRNIARLKEAKLFVSWLHSINFRVCYTMLEKRKQSMEDWGEESYHDLVDSNPSNDPESQTIQQSEAFEMQGYLQKLPSKERQAITMRYINQMNLEDISRAMDCSLSSVKRYLVNGRKVMKNYLNERRL